MVVYVWKDGGKAIKVRTSEVHVLSQTGVVHLAPDACMLPLGSKSLESEDAFEGEIFSKNKDYFEISLESVVSVYEGYRGG